MYIWTDSQRWWSAWNRYTPVHREHKAGFILPCQFSGILNISIWFTENIKDISRMKTLVIFCCDFHGLLDEIQIAMHKCWSQVARKLLTQRQELWASYRLLITLHMSRFYNAWKSVMRSETTQWLLITAIIHMVSCCPTECQNNPFWCNLSRILNVKCLWAGGLWEASVVIRQEERERTITDWLSTR